MRLLLALLFYGIAFGATANTDDSYAPTYGRWTSSRIWGGGSIQNVVLSPSNPERLYTYVDVCGPYRSDNGGKHWYSLQSALPVPADKPGNIRGLSVDPRNADHIVVIGGAHWWKKGGIYVSFDGGKSFEQKVMTRFYGNDRRRRLGIAIDRDPFTPDTVAAASVHDGIWISRDNGRTWASSGMDDTFPSDFRYDRKVRDRIYLCSPGWGAVIYEQEEQSKRIPGGQKIIPGFFRSGDGGKSWQKLSDESPLELFQDPADSERLFGIFDERLIKLSTDGGQSWQEFCNGLFVAPEITKAIQPGRYNAIGGGHGFILLGDTDGNLWRLDKGSDLWKPIPRGKLVIDTASTPLSEKRFGRSMGSIVVDPANPNRWFITDWYAIWQTGDGGKNWNSSCAGVSPCCIFTVAADPFNEKKIYLGMADNHVFVSEDSGVNFRHLPPSSVNTYAPDPSVKGLVYAAGGKTSKGIIIVSEDGGKNWKQVKAGGLPNNGKGVFSVAVHSSDSRVFACVAGVPGAGAGGVYESSDRGVSWRWIGQGLPPDRRGFFNIGEFDGGGAQLVISADGSMLCFSRKTWEVYYREPNGTEWKKSPLSLSSSKTWTTGSLPKVDLAADPFIPGRFFLVADNYGLFSTEDGGRTWGRWEVTWGTGAIAFDAKRKGLVALNTENGILLSRDGGQHWIVLSGFTDLPNKVPGNPIALSGGRLYLGDRSGSGLYWTDLTKEELGL